MMNSSLVWKLLLLLAVLFFGAESISTFKSSYTDVRKIASLSSAGTLVFNDGQKYAGVKSAGTTYSFTPQAATVNLKIANVTTDSRGLSFYHSTGVLSFAKPMALTLESGTLEPDTNTTDRVILAPGRSGTYFNWLVVTSAGALELRRKTAAGVESKVVINSNVDTSESILACAMGFGAVYVIHTTKGGARDLSYVLDTAAAPVSAAENGAKPIVITASSIACAGSNVMYTHLVEAGPFGGFFCSIKKFTSSTSGGTLGFTENYDVVTGGCNIKDGVSGSNGVSKTVSYLAANYDQTKLTWVENGKLREASLSDNKISTIVTGTNSSKLEGTISEIHVLNPKLYIPSSTAYPGYLVDDHGVRAVQAGGSYFDTYISPSNQMALGGRFPSADAVFGGVGFAADGKYVYRFLFDSLSNFPASIVVAGNANGGAIEGPVRSSIQAVGVASADTSTFYIIDARHVILKVNSTGSFIVAGILNSPGMIAGTRGVSRISASSDSYLDAENNALYCCQALQNGTYYLAKLDLISNQLSYLPLPSEITESATSYVTLQGNFFFSLPNSISIIAWNPTSGKVYNVCTANVTLDANNVDCGFMGAQQLAKYDQTIYIADQSKIRSYSGAAPTAATSMDVTMTNTTLTITTSGIVGADYIVVRTTSVAGCDFWKESYFPATSSSQSITSLFPDTAYAVEVLAEIMPGVRSEGIREIYMTESNPQ